MNADEGKFLNEVLVTGGLWAMLSGVAAAPVRCEPVTVGGQATNELYVWPELVKSRYRLTVTMDPEPDDPERATVLGAIAQRQGDPSDRTEWHRRRHPQP